MNCDEFRGHLGEEGEAVFGGVLPMRQHLDTCAECRGEFAKHEELLQALAALPETAIAPPAWLEGAITETVTERAARVASLRRVESQLKRPRVLTGSALLAAGIAGAIIMRHRRRPEPATGFKLRSAAA